MLLLGTLTGAAARETHWCSCEGNSLVLLLGKLTVAAMGKLTGAALGELTGAAARETH